MVTLNRGFSYDDNGVNGSATATNVNLHALIDDATIADVAISEFDSNALLFRVTDTRPGVGQGTNLNSGLLYDPTENDAYKQDKVLYNSLSRGPVLTYSAAATALHGSVWIVDDTTDDSFVRACYTAGQRGVLGVADAHIPPGTDVEMNPFGIRAVLLSGENMAITAGDRIATSTFTGYGQNHEVFTSGDSGIVTSRIFAMALENMALGATGLATCMVFR